MKLLARATRHNAPRTARACKPLESARQVRVGDQCVDGDGVQDGQCLGGIGRLKDFEAGVAEVGSRDQPQQTSSSTIRTTPEDGAPGSLVIVSPASKGAGAALAALLRRQPRTGAWASAAV